ncbi:MAG: LuxR family transcriptional regulator [Bacteroidia bacterium]|nr:LuxR family transcriptional regulator [Bacteroidia bacterium]
MDILNDLSEAFLNQPFEMEREATQTLTYARHIAQMYARIEHAIAVLSDLHTNQSYIYKGEMADQLDLHFTPEETIQSIWEEEIFQAIHPDDLFERHLLELHFFHLLKTTPIHERQYYHTQSIIRMKDRQGNYRAVRHRTFYLQSDTKGNLWLDLCLYTFATEPLPMQGIQGLIVQTVSGECFKPNVREGADILSKREKEILKLISKGEMSKEIADKLSISVHTVNRHRQNILEKLHVGSSIEAIKVGQALNLIDL